MWKKKEKMLVTTIFSFCPKCLSSNIFILHRLRNKFLQLILISYDSASWELHQYSHRMCGPIKIPKLTPAPGTRTRGLMIARPTLYLTTTVTTMLSKVFFSRARWKSGLCGKELKNDKWWGDWDKTNGCQYQLVLNLACWSHSYRLLVTSDSYEQSP